MNNNKLQNRENDELLRLGKSWLFGKISNDKFKTEIDKIKYQTKLIGLNENILNA